MEFEKRNGFGNGNGGGWEERESIGNENGKVVEASTSSSTSSPARYIEHHVTKLDTLAGVAIRYGVEVADIKKMNGLVTDLQMFARKTLRIPLPGRHPPSPCLSNGHSNSGLASSSEQTPRRMRNDLFESFQSLKGTPEHNFSPSMNSLQTYYCLKDGRKSLDSCEMTIYNKESSSYHENGGSTTSLNPPLNHHRRSRSVANGFKIKDCDPTDDNSKTDIDKWSAKLRLQHQNSEPAYTHTPEKLLNEENGSCGWFSAITGKGLALRTKAGSRTNLVSEVETTTSNGFLTLGETISENSLETRRSSSMLNIQDQDISNGASIWFGLKPDLQGALAKPIFDGLPKPISGRRAKAALD